MRNVAHYCGIYGHKPTYGITNSDGHVMPGIGNKPDLAVTGPMARHLMTSSWRFRLSVVRSPTMESPGS